MEIFTPEFVTNWLRTTVRTSTPLLLAGLGETHSQRSGVLNIGLEGMMLTGAFASVWVTFATGDPWVGLVAGLLGGIAVALLQGLIAVTFGANQIVSGIALNFVALGLTTVLTSTLLNKERLTVVSSPGRWKIPVLSDMPFLGPVLFQHNVFVYAAYLLVPISLFLLRRTHFGLAVTATGEHPKAAAAAGINVERVRYVCLLICGALAGAGGAALAQGDLRFFVAGVVSGRGFIAIAAVIFGRWNPVGVMGACLLFGAADALQLRAQVFEIPINSNFLIVLPHILTLVVLAGFMGRVRPPAALGLPFQREEKL